MAAGVGLYFWFDTFQAGVQEEVGNATDSQFKVLGSSSTPMIITMETTIDVPYASAYYDYKKYDDHYITFTGYKPSKYQTGIVFNDSDTWVLEDERFVLEIPVQLKANANLHNVKIKVDLDNREILEGGGSWGKLDFAPYCLHLDRSNGYTLQYYDIATTPWKEFKGELHPISDAITFDDKKYLYKFDGDKPTLNLSDFITASTLLNSWGASNSDAQDAYLLSNTYPMGDIKAGEVAIAYVYVYANWGKFDANTGRIVATVPFEISSADGFSTSKSITFKLYQGGVS